MKRVLNPLVRPVFWLLSMIFFFRATISMAQIPDGGVVIDAQYHHLGDSEVEDWDGVAKEAGGFDYTRTFTAARNPGPVTLLVRHRDVNSGWSLEINGQAVAILETESAEDDFYYEVPTGTLVDGENTLKLVPGFAISDESNDDDIAFGHVRLYLKSLRDVLGLQVLRVKVVDRQTGEAVPCRLTITNPSGERPELFYTEPASVAVRDGLLYLHGLAKLELAKGDYRVVASRGTEWSRDIAEVSVANEVVEVALSIEREVETPGFVAADTHIHTLQFSGHGDASADERMMTLAGEGIEFPVATDHNHNLDYQPFQERMELNGFFTPVVGNEVTSTNGHFNAFPLNPDDEVPIYQESDWVKMVKDMRDKGAVVVTLNHPNWPDVKTGPFGVFNLNRATGDREWGSDFTFDAMELVNSTVNTPDPLFLFHDWFALLNRGERIFAVGVSDSHTVGDPVGQGRTYVRSSSDDPGNLNIEELCRNIRDGRCSVSLGIITDITIDGEYSSGDLVTVRQSSVAVDLRVQAPSWVTPTNALVFLNGDLVAQQAVPTERGTVTDATVSFKLPVTGIDAHLVCVVLGEPVADASWKTLNDYTLAATNPVFLDVNGDKQYASPRESARRVLKSLGGDKLALWHAVDILSPVAAVQLIAIAEKEFDEEDRKRVTEIVKRRAERSDWFQRYRAFQPRGEEN